ncbi:energy transducer TonB [Panacibacter sp. DH6]|uniref:Energy transducer TonB n=1 Tax=Panacibacter microcysteis TaxID=2793269 RepID=A0A931GYI6_9BACT|nr:energy transducer TonB [Panacibacter microcysteis]MBG9376197.1 energy transducer TonB [Panacibacter microcysteis]
MEANNILKADVLDIIFENRNKAYGAYDLRTTYNKRIKRSLLGMGAVCLVFTAGVMIANAKKDDGRVVMTVKDYELTNLVPEEKQEQVIVEPPKPKPLEVRTIAVTIPRIVPDEQVAETEVPSEEQIENVTISNVTKDGQDIGDIVAPPIEKEGIGEVKELVKEKAPEVFTIVQVEARYPGGLKEWSKFLERNLNTELPVENGAPVGQYTVVLSFIVDAEGNISDIAALNDPGFGTAQEAIKVIKRSKQWVPAIQNGRNVIYRQKQSITFVVNEG